MIHVYRYLIFVLRDRIIYILMYTKILTSEILHYTYKLSSFILNFVSEKDLNRAEVWLGHLWKGLGNILDFIQSLHVKNTIEKLP